jgi:putative PIG3 family NAD(P)H quinone oxidoreductase
MSIRDAAGIPETFFTVWTNVFQRGRLHEGETLLIHGGSSGIGTTAIQLAKCFGAHVYVTAGTDEKCEFCTKLGADAAFNYNSSDCWDEIGQKEKNGIDVILDMVGGAYFSRNVKLLATEGRLVQIALQEGYRSELDLRALLMKRITLTGSTLRPRTVAQKAQIAVELKKKVWPLLSDGTIKPIIHSIFPLSQASEAHRLMEQGSHIGKILLTT